MITSLRDCQSDHWQIFMIIAYSSRNDKANWWDVQRMTESGWLAGSRAGWFKWRVIEQQTRIKSVLMTSVFHLGSIRRLVEAEANTCSRERLQRAYWTDSPLNSEGVLFVYLTVGLGENSCELQDGPSCWVSSYRHSGKPQNRSISVRK